MGQVFAAHRRGCCPGTPAGGFLHRPLGDVEVEGADLPELGAYEVGLYMTRYDDSLFLREEERAALASRRP